jgi:hypothetical protein
MEIRDRTFENKCREECLVATYLQNSSQIITGADILERKIKTVERINRLNEWWVHENRERMKIARQCDQPYHPLELQNLTDVCTGYLQCCERIDKLLDLILIELTKYFNHDLPDFQAIIRRLDDRL